MNTVKCPQLASVSPIRVEGDRNPVIEGTIVTFSCPPGLILTGSNTSTCTENGEWKPDIKGTECKGELDNRLNQIHIILCLMLLNII